ncbi:hypothetical protein KPATCC21470_1426 [Kitasatospora purpeofusca]
MRRAVRGPPPRGCPVLGGGRSGRWWPGVVLGGGARGRAVPERVRTNTSASERGREEVLVGQKSWLVIRREWSWSGTR